MVDTVVTAAVDSHATQTVSPDAARPGDADGAALDALLDALGRLEDAIAREAAALAAADTAPLLDAVDDKRRALATVEALMRQPSLAVLLSGGGREAASLAQSPTWPRILDKLAACRTANDAVGGVLAAARRSTEASLKWLGLAADEATYAHTGTGRGPAPRDLAVC
ncbi:MAG TPA: hypothetical protein VF339_02750 [Gammaproteobacteria bacterium]